MKPTLLIVLSISLFCLCLNLAGVSYRNVLDIKEHAPATFAQLGFKIVGYEGYQIGDFETPGGVVWYTATKLSNDKVIFSAAVSKWGSEYHVYHLRALDAIAPSQ